jgi:putative spermidine/putrescine transport system permease protein
MAGLVRRREQRQRVFRWVVVSVLAVFFLLPLFAMLEFTTRGGGGTWRLLVDWPQLSETYPALSTGMRSLGRP